MYMNATVPRHLLEREDWSLRKKAAAAVAAGIVALSVTATVAEHVAQPDKAPLLEDQLGAGELMVRNSVLPAGDVLVQVQEGDTPNTLAQKIAAQGHIEEVAHHIKNQTEENGVVPTGAWVVLNEQEIKQDSPTVLIENMTFDGGTPKAAELPVVTYQPPR